MALLQGAFENPIQQPSATAAPRISEIIVSSGGHEGLTFAMLAHLSHAYKSEPHRNRWLTWVCPMSLGREALEQFNFDVLGMRILHPKNEAQAIQLFRDALAAGTSHTVVMHGKGFSPKYTPWLESAALAGDCTGLSIRSQGELT